MRFGKLADERELELLFPDCEPGAMPPFGPLYGQDVYVDIGLAAVEEIAFNAGTHTEAIRMSSSQCGRSPEIRHCTPSRRSGVIARKQSSSG